jgi:predicted ATPase
MADTITFTTFGDLLKHLRQRARLTQDELGLAVGYSRAHIARLESNQRSPDPANVRSRFVDALDLANEPNIATRLIALAEEAHGENHTEPESLRQSPNNLPLQLASFIGREQELQEVQRLLHTTRLLTLIGAGGAGKTRLAIEVGTKWVSAGDCRDGVWLTRLEALTDAHLVIGAVATAVDMHISADVTLNGLIAYLRPRYSLLILNNCEHLIGACAELTEALLRECPHLRILATSREALNIEGEQTWRVPSMTVSDAAHLFQTRARVAHADFALTNENTAMVEDICQRLDGIPLALELAAARLRVLTVQQIAARLDDRFALLTGGTRNALPRQQTLRATIDWSYDLLTNEEQVLLRKLSVFVGGWTLEAAEAVCGKNTLDGLQQLVNKSLVVADEVPLGMRYRMLATIRQYAHEKLTDANEQDEMRKAHAKHYTQWLESIYPHFAHFTNTEQKQWVDRTEIEYDNVRAALDWAMHYRKPYVVMRVAEAIKHFWGIRGYTQDGLMWADAILERPDISPRERLHALVLAAYLCIRSGSLERANQYCAKAYAIADGLGDEQLTLLIDCYAASLDPKLERGIARVENAIRMVQRFDWITELVGLLWDNALLMMARGDFAKAEQTLLGAMQQEHGYTPMIGAAYLAQTLGQLAQYQGDYVKARVHLEDGVRIAREQGAQIALADGCVNLGAVVMRQGDYQRGVQVIREAIQIFQWVGNQDRIAQCLSVASGLALIKGYEERAVRWLAGASQVRETMRTIEAYYASPAEYDPQLAAVRAAVDPAIFERAWAEGKQMTLDQAVESVLTELQ